jgi:hypothetical protein
MQKDYLWSSDLVLSCSSANKCLLKVAQYAAQLEQYDKAIEIYEQVGADPLVLGSILIIMLCA